MDPNQLCSYRLRTCKPPRSPSFGWSPRPLDITDINSFPSMRKLIEKDYEANCTDRDSRFRKEVTDANMVSIYGPGDYTYFVADPLLRSGILLKSTDFSDICFVVGEERIRYPAHKFILAMSSPVFYTMFFGMIPQESTISLPDILPESFQLILEYIYTGLIPRNIQHEVGISAVYACRKYMLENLEHYLEEILQVDINGQNVFILFEAANFFDLQALKDATQSYIDAKMNSLIMSEEFLMLDDLTLCQVIRSDFLNVNEMDLYKALLRWADVDCCCMDLCCPCGYVKWNEARNRLYPLLKYVRFPTMTAREFADGVGKLGFLTTEDIGSILLYICSTKPDSEFMKFNPKPRIRSNTKAASEIDPVERCECEKNGVDCFFCFPPHRNNERWVNISSPKQGQGPFRPRGRTPNSPTPYCGCRTRRQCPGHKRTQEENFEGNIGATSTTSTNASGERPIHRLQSGYQKVIRMRLDPR